MVGRKPGKLVGRSPSGVQISLSALFLFFVNLHQEADGSYFGRWLIIFFCKKRAQETLIYIFILCCIMDDMDLSRLHNSLVYYLVNMGSLDQIDEADELTRLMIQDLSQSYAA